MVSPQKNQVQIPDDHLSNCRWGKISYNFYHPIDEQSWLTQLVAFCSLVALHGTHQVLHARAEETNASKPEEDYCTIKDVWRAALTKREATSHTCGYLNLNFSTSIKPATFEVLKSHMWLVTTILNSVDIGHF